MPAQHCVCSVASEAFN